MIHGSEYTISTLAKRKRCTRVITDLCYVIVTVRMGKSTRAVVKTASHSRPTLIRLIADENRYDTSVADKPGQELRTMADIRVDVQGTSSDRLCHTSLYIVPRVVYACPRPSCQWMYPSELGPLRCGFRSVGMLRCALIDHISHPPSVTNPRP